jgi:hypothetical protein
MTHDLTRIGWLAVRVAVLSLAGCGGAGTSGSGHDAADDAPEVAIEALEALGKEVEIVIGTEVGTETDGPAETSDVASTESDAWAEAGIDAGIEVVEPSAEHAVNAQAEGNQVYPAAAALEAGGYVVAWQSSQGDGAWRVRLRCLGAAGEPAGLEFGAGEDGLPANESQERPDVAALGEGAFVVAWQQGSGTQADAWAQRFDGCGAPHGVPERLNTVLEDWQGLVSVAGLPGRGFVAAWESECKAGRCLEQDGSWSGVFARRVAWDPLKPLDAAELRVNTYTIGQQENAHVLALAGGGYWVTWSSLGQVAGGWDVFGQRFDASGAPAGEEFRVDDLVDGLQSQPSAAQLADGRVVVAWMSRAQDGSEGDVRGRLYGAGGEEYGGEFPLAPQQAGVQLNPSVARLGGGFVAAWESDDADGDGFGIQYRRFDGLGGADPQATRVNLGIAGDQRLVALAPVADGFLAVWASRATGDWDVFSRLF